MREKIQTDADPIFLTVIPDPRSKPNECFHNVWDKVKRDGGKPQFGWVIWEAPGRIVEGEFHCAWVSPEGKLLCISSREDSEGVLVFLPDDSRPYDGRIVPNIGISWPQNPKIDLLLQKEFEFQDYLRQHQDPRTGFVRCPQSEVDRRQREIDAIAGVIG